MELDNGSLFRSFEHDLQRGGREAPELLLADEVHETEVVNDDHWNKYYNDLD